MCTFFKFGNSRPDLLKVTALMLVFETGDETLTRRTCSFTTTNTKQHQAGGGSSTSFQIDEKFSNHLQVKA